MGPVQQAFHECHALQCGFCTPGFVTTVAAFLETNPDPTPEEAREAISGNLCRCTGYVNIVAVGAAAAAGAAAEGAAGVAADDRAEAAAPRPAEARLTVARDCSASAVPRRGGRAPGHRQRAVTSTTWGTTRWRRRSCGARTRTPGSWTST